MVDGGSGGGCGLSGLTAGEDASAQEGAFQGSASVDATAAEAGDLTGGVQAGNRLAGGV
jgi:hypothetical protein